MYSYAKVGRFLEVTKMGCKCQWAAAYQNLSLSVSKTKKGRFKKYYQFENKYKSTDLNLRSNNMALNIFLTQTKIDDIL